MTTVSRKIILGGGLLWAGALLIMTEGSGLAEKRGVAVVDGKSPVDYIASKTDKSWAVVIGIDEYAKLPKLKYAVADAKAVAKELEDRGYQVVSLYNGDATRQNILGALGDSLAASVGEHDRVVVFFAGHGQTKKSKGGKEMGYLLPVQGEQESLAGTGISMGAIRDLSDALPSKHVLFLIDACYGGLAGVQFRSIPRATDSYIKTITRERGRQLITAGGKDQEAMEGPEWGHSVFTHFLLEGLKKGLADLNEDGIIPASELYAYLDSRVFQAAQMKGHTQRPELWAMAPEKGEFVFFTNSRTEATTLVQRDKKSISSSGGMMEGSSGTPSASAETQQELARLREELKRTQEQQYTTMKKLEAQEQQAREPMAKVKDSPENPPAQPIEVPLPKKNWSCSVNGWVFNGTELGFMDRAKLSMALKGQVLPGGCYWYDTVSGLIGHEGGPAVGALVPGLGLGGPLRADASHGDTGVFINGREVTPLEVQYLKNGRIAIRKGRYWLNAQGIGGKEGGAAEFRISDAAQQNARAQQRQGNRARNQVGDDHYYQSGNTYGGVQGGCVYMGGSDFSYIGSGC